MESTQAELNAIVQMLDRREKEIAALKLLWSCSEAALKLLWSCSEASNHLQHSSHQLNVCSWKLSFQIECTKRAAPGLNTVNSTVEDWAVARYDRSESTLATSISSICKFKPRIQLIRSWQNNKIAPLAQHLLLLGRLWNCESAVEYSVGNKQNNKQSNKQNNIKQSYITFLPAKKGQYGWCDSPVHKYFL